LPAAGERRPAHQTPSAAKGEGTVKVTSERLENCEVMLTIELDAQEVEDALRKAARKVSQNTNIPGFRRGKAPYPIVLQTFGRRALLDEAIEDLGQDVYERALAESKIEPYAQAEMVDVQLDPLVLKLRVPVQPEVDLGDYRALRLDVEPAEVSDEEVESAIEALRDNNAVWLPAERGIQWGDRVTLTYARGAEQMSEPKDLVFSEESRFPAPGFQAKLLGAKAGEERSFDIMYPADWGESAVAGQVYTFRVQVLEVKQKELPALEELPALLGDYADLDALRAGVRKGLQEEKEQRRDRELLEKALDVLVEQAKIEYPKALLEEELDSRLRRQNVSLEQQGLNLENYLKILKLTEEEYRERERPAAVESLKRSLILNEIARREHLSVKEDEVKSEIEDRTESYEGKTFEQIMELLTSPAGVRYIVSEVLLRKAYQRLLAIIKGEAPELPAETPAEGESTAPAESEPTPPAEAPAASEAETPAEASQPA
jgi:trigger factor